MSTNSKFVGGSSWESYGTLGEGARVALLDTGVDETHPGFENRLIEQRNIVNPLAPALDEDGHGTHCAGVIFQVAPACNILSAKILTRSGMFTDDALQGGLLWARRMHANVVCICTGSQLADENTELLIAEMRKQQIVTVAAIGNSGGEGHRVGIFPARYPSVLAVGSTDDKGELSVYTSLNSAKDIFCLPGEDVVAEHLGHTYVELSGTSVAAARLCGYLALVVSHQKNISGKFNANELFKRVELTSENVKASRGVYRRVHPQLLF